MIFSVLNPERIWHQ